MKLITKDTDYAVRAIMYISEFRGKLVTAANIQKKLNLPNPFLRKILQMLQKAGILNSVKGNKGGFTLAKSPDEISLIDLMEVFQGKITLTDCFLKKMKCPSIPHCPVRKKIKGIEKNMINELQNISIRSLLDCK